MGDALIGLGILLAIIGPLLLIPVIWLVYRCLWWALVHWAPNAKLPTSARQFALSLAVVAVIAVTVASYLPGRWEFDRLCAEHSIPDASFRTSVDGFYRTEMFPYEAHKYLDQDSFLFVEAPHPYQKDIYMRYSKGPDGKLREEQIPAIASSYGFRQTFSELSGGMTMWEKVIYEVATDQELARAANITYRGGPLSLFLGSYGTSSCPDILSEEGSRHFTTFYDLESIVLRAESVR